jgi:hypothetical protein
MHHRFSSIRIAPTQPRRAAGLLAAGLSLAALAGCGSSTSDGAAKAKPTEFCTAVEQYVDASKAGDRTDMADALAASLDGLPEEGQRAVRAYVLALRGAPANHSPDEDGVTSDRTQEAFDAYVARECGSDAIPSAETTTSTTAAETTTTVAAGDQGTGTDNSTGDQGTDSGADSGTGSGSSGSGSTDGGMGSGSDSGGATG